MTESNATTAAAIRRPRWYQFSLRTLFIVTLVCAIPLGWVAYKQNQSRRQKELIENLIRPVDPSAPGNINCVVCSRVAYDFQQVRPDDYRSDVVPSEPAWLLTLLGDDAFREVEWLNVSVQADSRLSELDHFSQLHRLYLYHINLTDERLHQLPVLAQLRDLRLYGSFTSAGFANLRKFPYLTKLYVVVADERSRLDLSPLERLTHLCQLSLPTSLVTDGDLNGLRRLAQLQILQVAGPEITDTGLASLVELTQLRELRVTVSSITDQGLASLANLVQLQDLDLSENPGITGAGFRHLTGLKQLTGLNLRNTRVNDEGLRQLAQLTQLKTLSLEEAAVTREGVLALQRALPKCHIDPQYLETDEEVGNEF